MSLKLIIIAVLMSLLVLPYTHYKAYEHGRITMNAEIAGKAAFVLNGKVAVLDVIRQLDQCSTCHTGGM